MFRKLMERQENGWPESPLSSQALEFSGNPSIPETKKTEIMYKSIKHSGNIEPQCTKLGYMVNSNEVTSSR